MRFKVGFILVIVCQVLDLILASMCLTPELEWNPVARLIWESGGIVALGCAKAAFVCISLGALVWLRTLRPRIAEYTLVVVLILSAIPLALYSLI